MDSEDVLKDLAEYYGRPLEWFVAEHGPEDFLPSEEMRQAAAQTPAPRRGRKPGQKEPKQKAARGSRSKDTGPSLAADTEPEPTTPQIDLNDPRIKTLVGLNLKHTLEARATDEQLFSRQLAELGRVVNRSSPITLRKLLNGEAWMTEEMMDAIVAHYGHDRLWWFELHHPDPESAAPSGPPEAEPSGEEGHETLPAETPGSLGKAEEPGAVAVGEPIEASPPESIAPAAVRQENSAPSGPSGTIEFIELFDSNENLWTTFRSFRRELGSAELSSEDRERILGAIGAFPGPNPEFWRAFEAFRNCLHQYGDEERTRLLRVLGESLGL